MFAKISNLLLDRPVARKVARNVFWLTLERFFRVILALVVSVVLARYLGPDGFGVLNLALAFVAIFGTLSSFGLNGILPRELVRNPDQANEILGSAFLVGMAAATCAYAMLVFSAYALNLENQMATYLTTIIGVSLFFKSTQVINYWFESQVDSKALVWTECFALLISSAAKLVLAWSQAPLVAFAIVFALEAALISAAAIMVYSKYRTSPLSWTASISRMRQLMSQSWPLLISSAAWILYTRIDQVMVGSMIGNGAVGHYTAATRLSDAANILPGLLVVSIVPAITMLRETDAEFYNKKFQIAYDLVFVISVVIALVLSLGSVEVIALAFGGEYDDSAVVLGIHAWSTIFVSMAVVSGRFLTNEGLQILTMQRHLLGVILNVALNYWLIGIYGVKGAALATLTSLIVVNYLVDALHPATRICFIHKSRSFLLTGLVGDLWRRLARS